ncbi:hypothetical protein BU14_0014s0102 [Porphyra umbilicalis]|uniref:At2g23090-like zinc-binding domain-containing protein n=1 Tax=Porphyra umbilicalis TaxID=2786 RepID=A0A1X6PLK3_PORUM|nr:hypothetical protein BU14_0014s0102 [Porphyra umbilicalis]|eukprot:OSX81553.1 hypothetical protein BU14_0014s0102 [Porphyra umbilicalis]
MGGGNGAKSKTKRERNATKPAKGGNTSQLGANLKAMSIICTVCKQSFMCTMAEASLRQHAESKHPKSTFELCFPSFGKA